MIATTRRERAVLKHVGRDEALRAAMLASMRMNLDSGELPQLEDLPPLLDWPEDDLLLPRRRPTPPATESACCSAREPDNFPQMSHSCPLCSRTQPGAAGAVFCMFCGGRLSADPRDVTDAYVPADPTGETDEMPVGPPERVGGYKLLRQLGSGGMGTVYEAEADDDGRKVAVKLLSAKLASNRTSVQRFKQEGRLASQISHPRCVFVYEADADAGRPFIVMELMPGTTLKDLIDQRGPLPVVDAVARMLDVIDGLIEAHRLGVIHRDIKPSNCFVTADDRMKVGDFGLSKSLDVSEEQKQLTGSGAFLGTVLFAPPEQIRGEEVGYDSDVYSVTATLYCALVGRAPYQHESLTAALAKAISEPPPSVREKRPEVPRGLDRVIRRGLDRERSRRWATLEDLRDELAEFIPGQSVPARRRLLIAAYFIDLLAFLVFVYLPVELLEILARSRAAIPLAPVLFGVYVAYFALAEGLLGTTLGKSLLRLVVIREERIGPPGVGPAALRAVVFHLLGFALFVLPSILDDIPFVGVPLAWAVGLAAFGALSYQLWPRAGGRGLHDRASGLRTVQRRRPAPRPRLTITHGGPADSPKPTNPPLPVIVGGYEVTGKLADLSGGGMVWAAEDRMLGRRILLWLVPAADVPENPPTPPIRPTRLRSVGTSEVIWDAKVYGAAAFVAPAGAPLPDLVDPVRRLSWADARVILEQLVEELIAAGADGTMPSRLGVDQLWAETTGRIHLLDFPIPTRSAPPTAATPVALLRQTATLLLEGRPRDTADRITAPVPPAALRALEPLFDEPSTDLGKIQNALVVSHAFPPRATASLRAAQLWLTALIASVPLLLLLGTTLANSFLAGVGAVGLAEEAAKVSAGLTDLTIRDKWVGVSGGLADTTDVDAEVERLHKFAARQRRANDEYLDRVHTRPERYIIRRLGRSQARDRPEEISPSQARQIVRAVRQMDERGNGFDFAASAPSLGSASPWLLWCVCLMGFAGFAFAFRGGVAYLLAGLTLVGADGRPAERWRCAGREVLAWLPLFAGMVLAVGFQSIWPTSFAVRAISAIGVVAVLGVGVVIALRYPDRGPHDRLAGTYVVPG